MITLEDFLTLPPITRAPKYIGLGLQIDNKWLKWYFIPTKDGICLGPVIDGHNIHLTAYSKDDYFYRHVTYARGCTKEQIRLPKIKKEDLTKIIYEEYKKSMPSLLERYSIYDEALVPTDAWWELFREIIRRIAEVQIKGRRFLMNFKLNYLIENEKALERRTTELGPLFRIGTVAEALQSPLRDRFLITPDGRPILTMDGETYIFRRNPLEVLDNLRFTTSSSVEDFLKGLEKSELSLFVRIAELWGFNLLLIELQRRKLLNKLFPST